MVFKGFMAVIKPSFAKLWLTLHQKQKVIIIMRKKSFILLLLFISNTSLFSQNPLTGGCPIREANLWNRTDPCPAAFEHLPFFRRECFEERGVIQPAAYGNWRSRRVDSFRSRKNVFLKRENHIGQREHPFIFSYLYRKKSRWFSFRSWLCNLWK